METKNIDQVRLEIDLERLELEKSKSQFERRFLSRNSGVIIAAAVSLAAVVVSLGQVWVTKISKDKELEVTTIQRKLELEGQDKQKDRELTLLDAQKRREWDLSVARFVADNRKALFRGTPGERAMFAKLIPTIFPPEISDVLLARLEISSPPKTRGIWREARKSLYLFPEQSQRSNSVPEPNQTLSPSTSSVDLMTQPQSDQKEGIEFLRELIKSQSDYYKKHPDAFRGYGCTVF